MRTKMTKTSEVVEEISHFNCDISVLGNTVVCGTFETNVNDKGTPGSTFTLESRGRINGDSSAMLVFYGAMPQGIRKIGQMLLTLADKAEAITD